MAKPGEDRRLSAAERRAEVIRLRRHRATFEDIGRVLGITKQRAHAIYTKALAELPAQQLDEHRAEELVLIDDAVRHLTVIALNASTSARTKVEAFNSIRGWAERKAKLLGLDAPAKYEVLTLEAIDAEIARLTAKLLADGVPPVLPAVPLALPPGGSTAA